MLYLNGLLYTPYLLSKKYLYVHAEIEYICLDLHFVPITVPYLHSSIHAAGLVGPVTSNVVPFEWIGV